MAQQKGPNSPAYQGTVGDRLVAYARDTFAWNAKQLAAELDVSYETLRKWMSDETAPNRNRVKTIAAVLGVSEEWITHGRVAPRANSGKTDSTLAIVADRKRVPKTGGMVAIGVMNAAASMGDGAHVPEHEEVVAEMTVNEQWLRRSATFSAPENLSLLTGFGDSMIPTFHDGDVLMVDRGVSEVKIDGVYALQLQDELYIKRLQRRPDGSVLMISDNKAYEPYTIETSDRDRFRVLGRVVMAWNAHRL